MGELQVFVGPTKELISNQSILSGWVYFDHTLSSPPPPCPTPTLPVLCWPDFPCLRNHRLCYVELSSSPPTTAASKDRALSLLPTSDVESPHMQRGRLLPPPLSPSGRNHHLAIVSGWLVIVSSILPHLLCCRHLLLLAHPQSWCDCPRTSPHAAIFIATTSQRSPPPKTVIYTYNPT